jgi:hypothetical protein
VPAGTSSYRLTAQAAAGLLAVGSTLTVRVSAVAGQAWESAGSASRTVRRTSVVDLGLDIRCS